MGNTVAAFQDQNDDQDRQDRVDGRPARQQSGNSDHEHRAAENFYRSSETSNRLDDNPAGPSYR